MLLIVKTRIRKWQGYRKSIQGMEKGETTSYTSDLKEEDKATLSTLTASGNAIWMEGDSEKPKDTPYESYVRGKKRMLLFKLAAFLFAVIGLILMYFLFVVGI